MLTNEWDLYESEPGFRKATAAINKAWREATRLAPNKPSSERARLAYSHVFAVMKQYSDVGALDSEPMWVLENRIRRHFGEF